MKKIIIAPDSFKGTLSAIEICQIMKREIHRVFPECQVITLPVADGGEGTCDCFLQALEGSKHVARVLGPFFDETDAFYCTVNGGRTAVIEMSAAAGLPLAAGKENPLLTTTYGVGQLVCRAIDAGATDILIGLGGSATTDGGAGMAAALGVKFYDKNGKAFVPVGGTLRNICAIDRSEAKNRLASVRLRAMCDVNNPLYGSQGAAYVFGPQKGADQETVLLLDEGLRHLGAFLSGYPDCEQIADLPGSGAAGGMGAGIRALLGGWLIPGIDAVLDTVHFDSLLSGCDLVVTGEGRIDSQSLRGKVVAGIVKRSAAQSVPVCAVVGNALDEELNAAYEMGLSSVFPINRRPLPLSEAAALAPEFLAYTTKNMMQLLKTFRL